MSQLNFVVYLDSKQAVSMFQPRFSILLSFQYKRPDLVQFNTSGNDWLMSMKTNWLRRKQ